MAIYEFICKPCGIAVEEEHSMANAPSETVCPRCEQTIKRYYGSMNFICKGEGWPSKNIRRGKAATTTKADRGLAAAKRLEDVQNARKKSGMPAEGKNAGKLSDTEVKKRKEDIHNWIDQG